MLVLGIETSCDETGIALYSTRKGIVAEDVYSQAELHSRYGGVVPELASRDHIRKTVPLVRQTLNAAGFNISQLDGVAYTSGPGLMGALMVGAGIGRALAWALDVPAIGVHHMEAHLLAPLLNENKPPFPFVALLVSGGHTQLVYVRSVGNYELLGESLDDAAGEAFDKTAKLLGLGYPGGPAIAKLALKGTPGRFNFPRSMVNRPGLDFSFSGLKTAVKNEILAQSPLDHQTASDIAHAFEQAVCETLLIKCKRAIEQTGCDALIMAGGVAANQTLRSLMNELCCRVVYPPLALCTDNGAMIAFAGHERLQAGFIEPLKIDTKARWKIASLSPLHR